MAKLTSWVWNHPETEIGCLNFLGRLSQDIPVELRNSILDYCIRLVFKKHLGSSQGVKELEDFTANMSIVYIRYKNDSILEFISQYLKDATTIANENKVHDGINQMIDCLIKDIKTIKDSYKC